VAKTLFMIHGMWGGAHLWANYRAFFEGLGYACVTPTLRHHDVDPQASPPEGLGTASLLDYAEDLERQIRSLGEPPVVMGHSMGGLLAQILAARGLCAKAVLLTPAAPRGIVALRPSVIRSFWSGLTTWAFWRKPYRPRFEEAVYAMMHLLSPQEQREAYGKFVHESGRAAFEIGFWLLDSRRAADVDGSRVTCPVLVVGGGLDRITPASVVRRVGEKYGAQYKEFPGHAHWVLGEPGWEEVAGFAAGWLAEKA
jgi:pimeloyl-ACP methyl ester carboxylesterase